MAGNACACDVRTLRENGMRMKWLILDSGSKLKLMNIIIMIQYCVNILWISIL